jgi:hypothetical protein
MSSLGDRLYRHRRRYLPRIKRRYATFYGRFQTLTGKIKGHEYRVRLSDRLSKKGIYRFIGETQRMMKYEHLMPVHHKFQTFSSFRALFDAPKIRIRKILDYDVHVKS